jgi:hypothetical protein
LAGFPSRLFEGKPPVGIVNPQALDHLKSADHLLEQLCFYGCFDSSMSHEAASHVNIKLLGGLRRAVCRLPAYFPLQTISAVVELD